MSWHVTTDAESHAIMQFLQGLLLILGKMAVR